MTQPCHQPRWHVVIFSRLPKALCSGLSWRFAAHASRCVSRSSVQSFGTKHETHHHVHHHMMKRFVTRFAETMQRCGKLNVSQVSVIHVPPACSNCCIINLYIVHPQMIQWVSYVWVICYMRHRHTVIEEAVIGSKKQHPIYTVIEGTVYNPIPHVLEPVFVNHPFWFQVDLCVCLIGYNPRNTYIYNVQISRHVNNQTKKIIFSKRDATSEYLAQSLFWLYI